MLFTRSKATELKAPITRTIPDDMEICYEYTSLTLERSQAEEHFLDNIEFTGKAASSMKEKQIHLLEFGSQ